MKRTDFNDRWYVRNLTEGGEPVEVRLPHDAMLSEPRTIKSRGEGNIGWYAGYDYSYEKTFTDPRRDSEDTVIFEFEGVYKNAEVYINDKKAAFRPYGYTNFYVCADEYLTERENTIRVIARNSDQPNSRWYTGTGIYRPVWLWTGKKKAHIPVNGVRIRTVDYKTKTVAVEVDTVGDGVAGVEVLDGEKTIAASSRTVSREKKSGPVTTEFIITIDRARLWEPEDPKLYDIRVSFGEDEVREHFGIRTLAWDTKNGLTINGRRTILRGACIHHDNGPLGACTYPEAEERRVRLLKEAGYNAIRSAHNPCSKYLLDACDRLGVLVMDEYIDHWYIHKTKYDYVDYMPDWWKQDLFDMVQKDYNHPSVIMYSTGNEVAETGEKRGIKWQQDMTDYLHSIDPTRAVTCGINIFFNFLYSIGLGVYSDDKAEAESEAAADTGKAKKKAPVGSEFYNMLAVKLGDKFMKFGATLYPCDLKTRDAYAAMDIAGYNYGIWRYKKDLRKYPDRLIVGSETFCKDAWLFTELARDNPGIVGDFVWSGIDYIGETGLGSSECSSYDMSDRQETCMTGGNGRIDITGKLRAEAYYTRVAFGLESGPYIAVNPVYEDRLPDINGWGFSKALRSYAFFGCDGKKATVEVYARGAYTELLINGRSYGKKKIGKTCRVIYKVPYESGRIEAICYDDAGNKIGCDMLQSGSGDYSIKIEPEESTMTPGRLCFFRLRYADESGITGVMKRGKFRVSVERGRLIGLCSGAPYVEGNYTDDTVSTYYGEALAVVMPEGPAEELSVRVTDDKGGKALWHL